MYIFAAKARIVPHLKKNIAQYGWAKNANRVDRVVELVYFLSQIYR
jgi:hypothetical protein